MLYCTYFVLLFGLLHVITWGLEARLNKLLHRDIERNTPTPLREIAVLFPLTIFCCLAFFLRPFFPLMLIPLLFGQDQPSRGVCLILVLVGLVTVFSMHGEIFAYFTGKKSLHGAPIRLRPGESVPWDRTTQTGRGRLRSSHVFLRLFLRLPAGFASIGYGLTHLGGQLLGMGGGESAQTILDHVYFSFVSVSTLGFGDIRPVSSVGKVLVVFQVVMFVTAIGCFLGLLTTLLPGKGLKEPCHD